MGLSKILLILSCNQGGLESPKFFLLRSHHVRRPCVVRMGKCDFILDYLGNENEARVVFAKETAPPLRLFCAIIPSFESFQIPPGKNYHFNQTLCCTSYTAIHYSSTTNRKYYLRQAKDHSSSHFLISTFFGVPR